MKVIIEEERGKPYKIVHLEKEALEKIKEQAVYIEEDFELELGQKLEGSIALPVEMPFLFAYMGKRQNDYRIAAYYDLKTGAIYEVKPCHNKSPVYWINCFSETTSIHASEYIRCIETLVEEAKRRQLPLIIYGDLHAKLPYYRYRTLTYKIIQQLLKKVRSVLIIKSKQKEIYRYFTATPKAFEFYLDTTLYLDIDCVGALKKVMPLFKDDIQGVGLKSIYRIDAGTTPLYNDFFYQKLDNQQKIYVPMNLASSKGNLFFKEKELNAIEIFGNHYVIYDTKEKIDQNKEVLQAEVTPMFTMPVLSRCPLETNKSDLNTQIQYKRLNDMIKYKGKGVYIGIVGVDGVQYEENALRYADGSTRIAYIWEQEEGNEGKVYDRQQINKALLSAEPKSEVPVYDLERYNTSLLIAAGGKSKNYEAIATESEFLVAKVKTAPEVLQSLFGGVPGNDNILVADLLVGVQKLFEYARSEGRPIVIIVPYYTNIDTHDGSNIYSTLFSFYSLQPGCAIVTPTGEEADKLHHQLVYQNGILQNNIALNVAKDQQSVVGLIAQRFIAPFKATLSHDELQVEISKSGETFIGQTKISSSGIQDNYYNGCKQVSFQVQDITKGIWTLEIELERLGDNRVDLWLSTTPMNPSVTLSPYDVFTTVGSLGNIESFVTIAGYDEKNAVALSASGRGFTWVGRVTPTCAVEGKEVVVLDERQNYETITGTIVSAVSMAGALATILQKWVEEVGRPYANAAILINIIYEYLLNFDGVVYPNPNQGYGIFKLEDLYKILENPFA